MNFYIDEYTFRGLLLLMLGVAMLKKYKSLTNQIFRKLKIKISKKVFLFVQNSTRIMSILYIIGGIFLILRRTLIDIFTN